MNWLAFGLHLGEYWGEEYIFGLGGCWVIYGPPDIPALDYMMYVMWAC